MARRPVHLVLTALNYKRSYIQSRTAMVMQAQRRVSHMVLRRFDPGCVRQWPTAIFAQEGCQNVGSVSALIWYEDGLIWPAPKSQNSIRELGPAPSAPKVRELGLAPPIAHRQSSWARIRHQKFVSSDSAPKVRELGFGTASPWARTGAGPGATLPKHFCVTANTCDGPISSSAPKWEIPVLAMLGHNHA